MFTLAHLTDPHLGPMPAPGLAPLAGKRITGFLSWRLNRHRIHLGEVLEKLLADLHRQKPDHTVVTGDLVNISLPGEFDLARAWLEEVGAPDSVSVVPGNHDAYTRISWREGWAKWAAYMSDEKGDSGKGATVPESEAGFPFVRRRGPVAIVGVNSGCPTAPFVAGGRIGSAQAERLAERLAELGEEGLFRVVLIHHPPLPGGSARRKQLFDAALFREALQDAGAELVLHGHTHRASLVELPVAGGVAPVIGATSASAGKVVKGKGLGSYHLYRIEPARDGWKLNVNIRAAAADLRSIISQSSFSLNIQRKGETRAA